MNELKINGFSAVAENEMISVNGGDIGAVIAIAVTLYEFGEYCGKGLGKLLKKIGVLK